MIEEEDFEMTTIPFQELTTTNIEIITTYKEIKTTEIIEETTKNIISIELTDTLNDIINSKSTYNEYIMNSSINTN